jgi:hypothetical protein
MNVNLMTSTVLNPYRRDLNCSLENVQVLAVDGAGVNKGSEFILAAMRSGVVVVLWRAQTSSFSQANDQLAHAQIEKKRTEELKEWRRQQKRDNPTAKLHIKRADLFRIYGHVALSSTTTMSGLKSWNMIGLTPSGNQMRNCSV